MGESPDKCSDGFFLPSTACGRGKDAEGGEGEGLKGGPCSQALTLARCACLSLSRKR